MTFQGSSVSDHPPFPFSWPHGTWRGVGGKNAKGLVNGYRVGCKLSSRSHHLRANILTTSSGVFRDIRFMCLLH